MAPQLRSVDCWSYDANTANAFVMLAAVESLGLICAWTDITDCIQALGTFRRLRELRLVVKELDGVPPCELASQIRRLLDSMRSLTWLTVVAADRRDYFWGTNPLDLTQMKCNVNQARRKLALLSVVRRATAHAINRLDACVLSVVFSMLGTNLEYIGQCAPSRRMAAIAPSPIYVDWERDGIWA